MSKEKLYVYKLSEIDIYDFAGWLTTRKGVMEVGSSCPVSPMAEAVGEYIEKFPERFDVFEHEWIGLTDDDIIDALDLVGYDAQAFSQAYAVEAKLKEKNK